MPIQPGERDPSWNGRLLSRISYYSAFNVSVCVEGLGQCLFNLVNVIPAGMIIIFLESRNTLPLMSLSV